MPVIVYNCLAAIFSVDTVRLTSIDLPQIEGAYISGLRAANFIFLVCGEGPDATIGFA